jgi:mannose-1-phosphate guanylyltransferase
MKDLVILAGGKGLRLGRLTKKNQKTMLNFAKIPFLRYLLNYYCKFNINKIFIITSFNSKKIFKEFHKKKINLVDIFCINQQKPNGTAKALQLVKSKVSKEFILANGDTFFETNLDKLLNFKLKKNYGCMVLIKKNKNIFSQKLNTLSIKKKFVTFNSSTSSLVSSGVMLLSKKIFNFIDNKSASFENDVLQKKIEQKKI